MVWPRGSRSSESSPPERPRQSISEVAAICGLDRATTRRCLLTLAHQGYADYDGKFFTLTPRILRLVTACLPTIPLPQIVQPLLVALSHRIGESRSVSILDGDKIVYFARAAQREVMSIALMPGSRLPAYCASMGRFLLAAQPHDEADTILRRHPLTARTPNTLTDPATIHAELGRVRTQGDAVIDEEVEVGLRSIAVPLRNARGRAVATVNIGLPSGRMAPEDLPGHFLSALLLVQADLQGMLA